MESALESFIVGCWPRLGTRVLVTAGLDAGDVGEVNVAAEGGILT